MVALQRPDLVIERSTLIRALARQAQSAGTRLLMGRRLRVVEPTGSGLTFSVEHGRGGIVKEE